MVRLLNTTHSVSAAIARLVLAGVILPHGYLKITRFSDTLAHLTGDYGLSPLVGGAVILVEFLAPLLLLFGIGSRLMAGGITAIMLGAIPYHLPNGFFMNWFHNQAGEGVEYHLLAIGLAVIVIIEGAGRYSLDSLLSRRLNAKAGNATAVVQPF
jgi:putative oxidoreductase